MVLKKVNNLNKSKTNLWFSETIKKRGNDSMGIKGTVQ
jgi:hypothetical protein